MMLKNYIITSIRNLLRNKSYTFINIFGLAVGLAATIMLVLYIRFELSFDKHFHESEKIYRIISIYKQDNGQETVFPSTLYELPEAIKNDIPEVNTCTRTWSPNQREIKYENISKGFHRSILADSCFFKVFSIDGVYGNQQEFLKEPNHVVLSQSLSYKIFGNEDPTGKILKIIGRDMQVDGVVQDLPENTHIQFDYLISMSTVSEKQHLDNGNSFSTYVLFNDAPGNDILTKTQQFISGYVNKKFEDYGITYTHYLQALKDIHLKSDYADSDVLMGNIQYIYIFSGLAFFILFIAILNYINLFTAKSESRLKEVGIRKVLGATKSSLLKQFIGESLIVSLLSFLIAMLLVESFLFKFGELVNSNIQFNYSSNLHFIALFALIAVLVGILSGIYPALYIIKFNLINILKGNTSSGKKNVRLKVLLVVIQFTISVAVISSLFGLFAQVNYLKNKNLGFAKDQVVVFQALTRKVIDNYEAIKNELLKNPNIMSVTASQSVPGLDRSGMNIRLPEWAPEEAIPLTENRVQDDYVKTYGLELIEGKDFSQKLASDSSGFILNESAVKLLNIENPIGKKIVVWVNEGYIKGVVKDFHITSLHKSIEPMVLSHYASWFANISIRIEKGKNNEAMDYIKKVFTDFDPDFTQNYFFIGEHFDNMYRKEDKANKLIFYASLLTIIISLLGLLALTSYSVSRRTKEIGIRKALGADVKIILVLINKDILRWILVSSVLGTPIAYFFLEKWLRNFAYRVDIQVWFFVVAVLITLLVAMLTISIQSFKAAKRNPVHSLRYE